MFLSFLQRVRIARNADRCNSQTNSVCLSVGPSHFGVTVFCPDKWRYDCAVFSIRKDHHSSFGR